MRAGHVQSSAQCSTSQTSALGSRPMPSRFSLQFELCCLHIPFACNPYSDRPQSQPTCCLYTQNFGEELQLPLALYEIELYGYPVEGPLAADGADGGGAGAGGDGASQPHPSCVPSGLWVRIVWPHHLDRNAQCQMGALGQGQGLHPSCLPSGWRALGRAGVGTHRA